MFADAANGYFLLFSSRNQLVKDGPNQTLALTLNASVQHPENGCRKIMLYELSSLLEFHSWGHE